MTLNSKEMLRDWLNAHFNYEVIELVNSKDFYNWMATNSTQIPYQAFLNIGLEHILLHERNLYEFFFELKENINDYSIESNPKANMYIESFTKPEFDDVISDDFHTKASHQIQHMGIYRTSQITEKFNKDQTIAIANRLLNIIKDFLIRLEEIDNGFYFQNNLVPLRDSIDTYIEI